MTQDHGHWTRIGKNEECSCELCGFPLMYTERAWCDDATGRLYCTRTCAHRATGHDDHRRKLTDEERAAFYPACNHINGRGIVRALVTLGTELDERRTQ